MLTRGAAIGIGTLALAALVATAWMAARPERRTPAVAAPGEAEAGELAPATRIDAPVAPSARGSPASPAATGAAEPPRIHARASLVLDVAWRDTGEPATSIPVAVQELDHAHPGFAWRFATTDLAGRARVEGLRGGAVRVIARAETERAAEVRIDRDDLVSISVPRGVPIRGRVTEPAGRTAAEAEIFVVPDAESRIPENAFPVGVTDAMGRFEIADLPANAVLAARGREHGPSLAVAVEGAGQREHGLSLGPPGAILLVQVLDGAESAVSDAPLVAAARDGSGPVLIRTDREGRSILRGLLPGEAVLLVHADGFAPLRAEISVRAGERNEHILRLAPGASVLGTVRGEGGTGVAGARIDWVEARADAAPGPTIASQARSLGDGSFRLPDLPGGSMTIRVHASGFEAADATVAVAAGGTARLDFDLVRQR